MTWRRTRSGLRHAARALAATAAGALLLACNASGLSPSAGPTRGRVVDCVTRAPLGGVSYTSGSASGGTTYRRTVGAGATTFADGTFERYAVRVGADRLDFSKPGYRTRVVFIPPDQPWTDVCLERER